MAAMSVHSSPTKLQPSVAAAAVASPSSSTTSQQQQQQQQQLLGVSHLLCRSVLYLCLHWQLGHVSLLIAVIMELFASKY